ncbi:hypothetical protein SAMD00079811_55240 [Scytonema sp. HK-05]|nr:hypothetical protein SAMD00079811_55240 [Scytonema sp. HK-05]
MKHKVLAVMSLAKKWGHRFDEVFSRQILSQDFQIYLGGLLGESDCPKGSAQSAITKALLFEQYAVG